MSTPITTPVSPPIRPPIRPPIFTRYLYIKSEVEHSLIHAILARDKDRALFWGYELYYSGHWTDTLALLSKIYDNYKQYSNLGNFLNKKCREYADSIESIQNTMIVEANDTISCIIGTIIKNLCAKNYTLAAPDRKIFIIMDCADIQKYKTVSDKQYSPRLVLQNVCEYTPWRESIIIDQPDEPSLIIPYCKYDKIEEKYYDHWLYYASLSPIWLHRIKKWNGVQNHKTQYIEFMDDFYLEQFYQLYNYEPDEQTKIVQNRNIPK